MVEGHHLTADQVAQYKEAFSLFDKDGNGRVNIQELGTVMRSLRESLAEEELQAMIREVDDNKSQTVDINEFLRLMSKKMKEKEDAAELKTAFGVFDKDGSGHISAAEIRNVMHNMNQSLTDEEVEGMIKKADVDENGGIDYQEFVKVIIST